MDEVKYQVKRFLRDEEGIAAAEYGILATLVLMICIVTVSAIGLGVADAFPLLNSRP
jgi:Flp pilus assembly pilin Flp